MITDQSLATVVVPTRNRPLQVAACLETILANDDTSFEVIVVDQSDDDRTASAVGPFLTDRRVTYLPSAERGVANARNSGWRAGSGSLILYTDDDCRVGREWISTLRAIVEHDSGIGIVFARVVLPENVAPGEFGAAFEPVSTVHSRCLPGPGAPWGISANMAVKRSVLERLGGFDPMLGAGGRFRSAAESDLLVRAVAAGYDVVDSPEPTVLHLGIRSTVDSSALVTGYAFGLGAAFGKHWRLRTRPGRYLLPTWVAYGSAHVALNAIRFRRPLGARFVTGLVRGAWASRHTPIDSALGIYLADPA